MFLSPLLGWLRIDKILINTQIILFNFFKINILCIKIFKNLINSIIDMQKNI